MSYIDKIKAKAKANKKTIILPETEDTRTLRAAEDILLHGYADIILLGNKDTVLDTAKSVRADLTDATIVDPDTDDRTDELAITEENMVTYRYLYQDGNTYYYQVNKEAYLDHYMSNHSAADRNELIVLYVPKADENEEKFIVISEDEFLRNGTELYELERIIEPVTTKYLDLLNIDEVAALKLEDYFISL